MEIIMVSVCIIVKNDEKNLEECLQRLQPYDLELVVVDTGSTDKSREVARKYTDCVYEFEWCDDFAKARNFSLSKATNDMVFILDSDELVINFNRKKVLDLVKYHSDMIGAIQFDDIKSEKERVQKRTYRLERIFNRKLFHYEGRIHEQIVPLKAGTKVRIQQYPIQVEHHGYDPKVVDVVAKGKRNLDLIQQVLATGQATAYDYFQAAQSYCMMNQYEEAIPYYEKALGVLTDTKQQYVHVAVVSYGYALLHTGRKKDALMVQALYEDYKEFGDYLFLLGHIFAENQLFSKAIVTYEAAAKATKSNISENDAYLAYYNCGRINEVLGKKIEAISYYKKCLGLPEAKEGLKRLLG